MNDYFVSVIIPVYNGEAFLAEAVDSIRRQDHDPLEVIIVDDGSSDNTAEIVTGLPGNIRYVYQPNSGPPAARNQGLRMASGNVIAFLDADDLWLENKLEVQLSYLTNEPLAEIVMGYTQLVTYAPGGSKPENLGKPWPAMSLGSTIMRKSAFDKVGIFDETQLFDDDVDWLLRAKELQIPAIIHEDVTQLYRRHKDNITNQKQRDQKFFMAALKKSLDRRRHAQGGSVPSLPQWFTKGKG